MPDRVEELQARALERASTVVTASASTIDRGRLALVLDAASLWDLTRAFDAQADVWRGRFSCPLCRTPGGARILDRDRWTCEACELQGCIRGPRTWSHLRRLVEEDAGACTRLLTIGSPEPDVASRRAGETADG